ncbi:MAG: outer membrane protein assembly factor BamD [Desulfobacteraceae bacterium]|nr:outer membrane protein assembly factor BamD [Desulfobacteraceae bacterium]
MKRFILSGILIMLVCSGCSTIKKSWDSLFGKNLAESAQELVWNGMDAYEDGDYSDAIANFQKLKDWYPFSKYAILAELKIADANYHKKKYEEAIFAYEEFEKLHPQNEAVPYVIYQIGRCYFDQIDTIDRDQTPARKAYETFQRLAKQFPDDKYARSGLEHIGTCEKSLAGNEYYIGVFYYNSKHYKAALHRFMSVLSDYPDVGYHQLALEYIAKCESELAPETDTN